MMKKKANIFRPIVILAIVGIIFVLLFFIASKILSILK